MKDLAKIGKNLGGIISRNSPHILTVFACTGVVGVGVLASDAGAKAAEIIKDEDHYRKKQYLLPLTRFEKAKLTWQCYIPTAVAGATAIGCIIGMNTIHSKRNAALASIYALSESAFREYKSKVVKEIGTTKERKIQDEIAKDHVNRNPHQGNIIFTGNGDVLCYDKLSGRYFTSSYETIRQKVNDLNYRLRHEMQISLNEFYYELGLPYNDLGEKMEFNIDKGQIEVSYSTQMSEDNRPCVVIDVEVYPCRHYMTQE